jgi:hypothetical protein
VNSTIMRMSPLPDFIIIGAMKSATTTLHMQLARQPGLWMSRPKEPNFFSDDENYAKGLSWYASCFQGAGPGDLRGESSTHYTKLPTHPRTVDRMVETLPRVKLIYVMRHPIDRLTSHYLHEQTIRRITVGLEQAVDRYPELVEYGRYSMQLEPYLRAYGPGAVHPVFFDRLISRPDEELERIGQFLGVCQPLRWDNSLKPQNVGRERLRDSRLRNVLVQAPLLSTLRQRLVPRTWVERAKAFWQVGMDPPRVPGGLQGRLRALFDRDLARLGSWLGIALDCDSFRSVTAAQPLAWAGTKAFLAETQGGRNERREDREGALDLPASMARP